MSNRFAARLVCVALFIFLSGCGGGPDEVLDIPPVDSANATETAPATEQTEPAEPTETTSTTTADPTDDGSRYTAVTVSFDPDNPPDEAAIADLAFKAVEAETTNLLWCYTNLSGCVLEEHIGPAVTELRLGALQSQRDFAFPSGEGSYQSGQNDGVYPVETLVVLEEDFNIADEFRFVAVTTVCEVYTGNFLRPDLGEMDLDYGEFIEYRILQDAAGVLKVHQGSAGERGEPRVCDSYKPE